MVKIKTISGDPDRREEDLPEIVKALMSPTWFIERVKQEVKAGLRKAQAPDDLVSLRAEVDRLVVEGKPVVKPVMALHNALELLQSAQEWLNQPGPENQVNSIKDIGPAVAYAMMGGAALEKYLPASMGGRSKLAANSEAWARVFEENAKLKPNLSASARANIIAEKLSKEFDTFPLKPDTIRKKI